MGSLKCESGSSRFQPGEGHSRGLLRDCTTSSINLSQEELVREVKENMALQNQAQKWIQVVKIDGLI